MTAKSPHCRIGSKALALVALSALVILVSGRSGLAQDTQFFRIGTGSSSGIYFPIGSIIAGALSSPPGSRSCEDGGSCGVPGMIAVAQTTHGSAQNVALIASNQVESGFSQADVAFWAYYGEAMFAKDGPRTRLRALANLYPEMVHIVVRRASDIQSVADLAGRRVSLGAVGSGTRLDAELILAAHGIGAGDIKAVRELPGVSADHLLQATIDAFVIVGGAPFPAIADLAERANIRLLPIEDAAAERVVADHPFFVRARIPDGVYKDTPGVSTLSIGAQWLISADQDEELVYRITRSFWHANTRKLLTAGHANGGQIQLESALHGIAIPLHEGAARYYREVGLLK